MSRKYGMIFLFLAVVLLWGTIIAAPFRTFAEMARDMAAAAAGAAGLAGFALAAAVHAAAIVLMAALLMACRSRNSELVAGICALAATVWHMASRLGDRQFTPVSTAVTVGLAVILACLVFKARTASLWLGAAYAASLAAMVLYDAAILPAIERFGTAAERLPAWLDPGGKSLVAASSAPAGIPVWIAGLVLAVLAAGILLALSHKRAGSRP